MFEISREKFENFISELTEIVLPRQGLAEEEMQHADNSAHITVKLDGELIFGCRFALNASRAKALKDSAEGFKLSIK